MQRLSLIHIYLKAQAGSAVAGAYYITPPACAAFAVEQTNELLLHFTSAVRTDPVSYTHLDVYKRQPKTIPTNRL